MYILSSSRLKPAGFSLSGSPNTFGAFPPPILYAALVASGPGRLCVHLISQLCKGKEEATCYKVDPIGIQTQSYPASTTCSDPMLTTLPLCHCSNINPLQPMSPSLACCTILQRGMYCLQHSGSNNNNSTTMARRIPGCSGNEPGLSSKTYCSWP